MYLIFFLCLSTWFCISFHKNSQFLSKLLTAFASRLKRCKTKQFYKTAERKFTGNEATTSSFFFRSHPCESVIRIRFTCIATSRISLLRTFFLSNRTNPCIPLDKIRKAKILPITLRSNFVRAAFKWCFAPFRSTSFLHYMLNRS